MAVVQLATSADVVAAFGRALTSAESAKVGAILDKASELFRRRSHQQFTATTYTVRVRITSGFVMLPQRTPSSITTVVSAETGSAVAYGDRVGQKLYITGLPSGCWVKVTYVTDGVVPDLVRLTVAEIAKKVLSISDTAASGATQMSETIGGYSYSNSYATWAQGGQTMLAPADDAIALSYRVKSNAAIVLTA